MLPPLTCGSLSRERAERVCIMKIRYRSNLAAGCIAIIAAVVLFLIIPSQVGVERKATFGINSRTLPYGLSILMAVCGLGLILQSLVFKKDEVKEVELKKEGIGLLYMLVLLAYGIGFNYSFLISTVLLGVITLAFLKDRQWLHYLIVILTTVAIYFIFTRLLHLRLP